MLLVARPASIVAAALPFRVPWREQAFLSWSGLRGAVPIVLAMIPLVFQVEHAQLLLNVIVVVVVIFTLLQGSTLPWVATRLGVIQLGQPEEIQLEAAPLEEMNAQVLQITIPDGSRMHGVYVSQLRLPAPAVIGLLLRNGEPVPVDPNIRLQSGDQLLVVAPERVRAATERRLRAVSRGGALATWFGERGNSLDDLDADCDTDARDTEPRDRRPPTARTRRRSRPGGPAAAPRGSPCSPSSRCPWSRWTCSPRSSRSPR